MKNVTDVLTKEKGADKLADMKTGKGAFSQAGFADLVSAMANDTTYKIPTYDKEGNKTGDVNISSLIREDLKKTVQKAGNPQKSEAGVFDTCEVYTSGLAKAIPQIVMQQLGTGRKFDLPVQEKVNGSIYLADVEGKVKETNVRSPKDQVPMGRVVTTSKDWIQVRTKSSTPKHLQTKVHYDVNGKLINK